MSYQAIIPIEAGKRNARPSSAMCAYLWVLGWLAAGMSYDQIIGDYPELTGNDILAYTADRERRVLTATT